jgi:hypothetical protein
MTLDELPRFPKTEGMTREGKFTSVASYLSKVVDHLQGVEDEHRTFVIRRPHTYRASNLPISPNFQVETVLHGISEAIAPPEVGEEHSNPTIRLDEVAESSD